jgi:hypothetical protein
MAEISAAVYLGVAPQTMRKMRLSGDGPAHITVTMPRGVTYKYEQADLDDWLENGHRRSTGRKEPTPDQGADDLNEARAAAYLGMRQGSLRYRRIRGTGPVWRDSHYTAPNGRRQVLYTIADLDAWASARAAAQGE